jgi:hypothetical protein
VKKRKYKSVELTCSKCGCTITLPEWEAEVGMRCPECGREKLARPLEDRKGKGKAGRVVVLRPNTVRALIGSVVSTFLGPLILIWGTSNFGEKRSADRFWASIIALGIGLIMIAVLLLIIGVVGLIRDLKE